MSKFTSIYPHLFRAYTAWADEHSDYPDDPPTLGDFIEVIEDVARRSSVGFAGYCMGYIDGVSSKTPGT